MLRPVHSSSAARPCPMIRGKMAQAPISQPARPTRVNRKAVLLRAVPKTVEKAPAFGFIARHAAAGAQQLSSATLSDDSRQDGASAHITTGKTHASKQKGGFAARGAKPDIGCHREDRTGAGADTINRRDD